MVYKLTLEKNSNLECLHAYTLTNKIREYGATIVT